MDVTIWIAFVAASTALLLVPGPTVLLIFAHALLASRTHAIAWLARAGGGALIAMGIAAASIRRAAA